jgi:uncharacterized integral membrane protein
MTDPHQADADATDGNHPEPEPATAAKLRAGPAGRDIPWRLVALAAILAYAIAFVVLNSDQVSVSFVFFTLKVSLVVAIVLAILIGFLGGYLFDAMRQRRKRDTKTR